MSSGRMVRVTRIDTGETWPSIAAAAKALFIAPTSLSRAKVSGRTHVCDIPLKFEDTMTSVNATEMKDLETGIVYPTIVSVADAFGVDTYQVYNNAKNGHRLRHAKNAERSGLFRESRIMGTIKRIGPNPSDD